MVTVDTYEDESSIEKPNVKKPRIRSGQKVSEEASDDHGPSVVGKSRRTCPSEIATGIARKWINHYVLYEAIQDSRVKGLINEEGKPSKSSRVYNDTLSSYTGEGRLIELSSWAKSGCCRFLGQYHESFIKKSEKDSGQTKSGFYYERLPQTLVQTISDYVMV